MGIVPVGVLGPTSLVGDSLVPRLQQAYTVFPVSRRSSAVSIAKVANTPPRIPLWVSLMPIWALHNRFDLLAACGARRVVALSSTSVFTKTSSTDSVERSLAAQIETSEKRFIAWAQERGVEWLILRPTLIYGHARDRNVTEIARFIRRFGFFPVFGPAKGLRQPIRSDDVAMACLRVLETNTLKNCSYNISGGEILPYRDMVVRIFEALGKRPRLIATPLWMFQIAVIGVRLLPRFHDWSSAMAERMNQDLVFDHTSAEREFGFSPSPFQLRVEDLPR
jgi:nucleoside-diphosphate-sugar epimerase